MRLILYLSVVLGAVASAEGAERVTASWTKYSMNPVFGGAYGTCFDVCVLREHPGYRMWVSWRPQKSVALITSKDGFRWSGPPLVVIGPRTNTGWEEEINRPIVIKRDGTYRMWYTGQAGGRSSIGYANSPDGEHWNRSSERPVLSPGASWEKVAVMCPHVLWDDERHQFRMWYSGGDQYEPDAIGYATSSDGLVWQKYGGNPVFRAESANGWERHKVTAAQVERVGGWYVMFYIGFRDVDHAQIGVARSRDGITGWQRLSQNPVISPTPGGWDADACYKPFAVFDGEKWLLWYNGRHGSLEQIGVAIHPGEDLGFSE